LSDILSILPNAGVIASAPWAGHGVATKHISKSAGNGCTCTAPWMNGAKRWNRISVGRMIRGRKGFFRKALKRHGQPRTITLDGFKPTHSATEADGDAE
jgi:hypothetical protein